MSQEPDTTESTQRTMLSPGPSRPERRSACVVVIHGEGLGKRADIGDRVVIVGRSQEADLPIPHRSVSRQHCRIWRDGEDYRIADLGATNTTRINDEAIAESVLHDGDQITLGETILKFISHSSVEALYHEEVYQLATHDALTELCNRRHFIEQLGKEIARSVRTERPLSLCIVDVDLFKRINDNYGHIAGDGVLKQIAGLLRQHVRADEVAARIGGEEFALLLPETGPEEARQLAERLREAVAAQSYLLGGERHRITISVGIAACRPQLADRASLMRAADTALYRAKDDGRNRVHVGD